MACMDYPKYPISEVHLGKFPDTVGVVQYTGKSTSRLKYVQIQYFLANHCSHWIKEVEIAKTIDDLVTSHSTTRRTDFSDYEMFDAKIASALKKIITSVHFRRKVTVEEQRAQKYDWFLWGRQIAHMTYEYSRATRAYKAVQGLSDLFNIRFQNDDVQDFDTRWDLAPLAASENTFRNGLGRFVQVKITGFCPASDCVGHVWQGECSK